MPLYEYLCRACGGRFEVIQKFSDPPPDQCARCGKGPVDRQMSSPAIQFKGTGWYITDYAQKGKSGGETASGTDGKADATTPSDGAGKSEAAPKSDSPAKTESTPASSASKSSSDS